MNLRVVEITGFKQYLMSLLIFICLVYITKAESSVQSKAGDSVTLVCIVDGVSQDLSDADVAWKHNGVTLFIDGSRIKQSSKLQLKINNVKYTDSGLYSCHTKSVMLNSTRLTVEDKPSFTEVFDPKTIFEGKEIHLECVVESYPVAVMEWKQNNVKLINGSSINITNTKTGNTIQSELRVSSASYLNNGTYSCTARNKYGTIKHHAPVQIYVAAYIKRSPTPVNIVRKGSDVTLNCTAFGYPYPRLFWFSDSINMSDITRFKKEKYVDGFVTHGQLKITGLRANESGNVTCIVVNSFSSVNSAVAVLKVQDVPRCCLITSRKINSRRMNLSWKVSSDGHSEIIRSSILLSSQFLKKNFVLEGSKSDIDIGNLSPNTEYDIAITAENAIGVSSSFHFKENTLKEDYSICISSRVKKMTSTSLTLSWSLNCSNMPLSDKNYIDVIVLEKNAVINMITYLNQNGNRSKLITGLSPYTEYGFAIREIEQGKTKGFRSEILTERTKPAAPSPPRNVKATPLDSTSITVSWDPPLMLNGIVKEYEVQFGYDEKDSVVHISNRKSINAELSPKREFVLRQLMMHTKYNISVRERTEVGLWSARSSVSVLTREGVPVEAPHNITMTLRNDSIVTLRWNEIPERSLNGKLIGYVIVIQNIAGLTVFNRTVLPNITSIHITTLTAQQQYEALISGLTKVGAGKRQSFIFFTAEGVPSAPRGLEVTAVSMNALKLTWRRPQNANGMITAYQIKWEMIKNAFDRLRRSLNTKGESTIQETSTDLSDIREYFIRNLTPFSIYSVKVRARTVVGWGPFTKNLEAFTLEGASSEPMNLRVVASSSDSITFQWSVPHYPNGAIKVFTVKCYQGQNVLKDHKNITFYRRTVTYKATCKNLKSGTETLIMVYAVSSVKGRTNVIRTVSAAQEGSFPWLPIIGGCVGFVVVVALIMTTVLLCRRNAKYIEVRETAEDVEMNGILNSRPIHIANLKQYVEHNHTNSDHGFFTEYESIKPAAENLSWEHSQDQSNQQKNRYSNIVAYDHTRVVLSLINNDPSTTYINANYIDGYKHPRKFIATQGPLPDTVNDFWRMIYEQGCHVIVMLTRIVEDYKVKCEEYWPDPGTRQYGEVIVKLVDVTELSDYVVRTFSVKAAYDAEAAGREVKQYHYLGWPDHGVPEYPTSMVSFTKYIMDNAPPKPGPIVVHCSAGVGRTGTLIVIDAMLNQIRDESVVDVYKFVSSMRRQRNFMVQTEAQYVFIYDALLDAVICGNTEATAESISVKLRFMSPQLMQEFKRLEVGISSQEKELFSIASLPENEEKNRFLNVLPYNRNRVKLAFIYGQKGSDYINASYVDGYRQRHAFIATQGPLENTVSDFWRMIWEQNCHNIVMLTKLSERGKERSRQYWPSCGSDTYGKFLVDELKERDDECENVTRRELNLTYIETGRSRRINHFWYTGWPEFGSPNSGTDLIRLISLVQSLTPKRGTGPIIVHCSGGAGRTGAFIALCICIQKLKTEGTVDVFQTVRQLRIQRPAMVQTIDQYCFCYQALKDYVDSTHEVPKTYDLDESLA